MKICLVYNLASGKEQFWINAFKNAEVDYKVIKLDRNDWMEQVLSESFDFIIALPNGAITDQKQLFDERVYTINKVLGIPIYPKLNELLVYENKRLLSYWLKANNLPHPKTNVFYRYDEAKQFLEKTEYPIVAKSNIGASGSGVHILKTPKKAQKLLDKTFKGRGFPRRSGPNFNKRGVYKRIFSKITDMDFLKKKFSYYKSIKNDLQTKQILFQEFIPHNYEWRTIKIGSTFISHQKVLRGDRASGSGEKRFISPDIKMLEFVKEVAQRLSFESGSFDLFENENGKYLINEIQAYYGTPHIMKVNGVSGRYIDKESEWIFEKGDFSFNYTCNLRLKHAMHLYKTGQLA